MAPVAEATADSSGIVPGPPAPFLPPTMAETGSKPSQAADVINPVTPKAVKQSESKTNSEIAEINAVTTGSKNLAKVDLIQLNTLKDSFLWRPVKFTRNGAYPKVVPDGFYFKEDSGGFALKKQATGKWYGHFTKKTVRELEKKYATKKPKTKNAGSPGITRTGNCGGSDR